MISLLHRGFICAYSCAAPSPTSAPHFFACSWLCAACCKLRRVWPLCVACTMAPLPSLLSSVRPPVGSVGQLGAGQLAGRMRLGAPLALATLLQRWINDARCCCCQLLRTLLPLAACGCWGRVLDWRWLEGLLRFCVCGQLAGCARIAWRAEGNGVLSRFAAPPKSGGALLGSRLSATGLTPKYYTYFTHTHLRTLF